MKRAFFVAVVVLSAAACAPQHNLKGNAASSAASGREGGEGEGPKLAYDKGTDMPEGDIRDGKYTAVPELETVYFEYDQYGLTPAATETLRKNADWLRQHPELAVLVAGHADEKGTHEYNLALGQKRAKTVREFYVRAGIDAALIGTISYGKEQPACTDQAYEVCGPKNRRAVTLAAPKKQP